MFNFSLICVRKFTLRSRTLYRGCNSGGCLCKSNILPDSLIKCALAFVDMLKRLIGFYHENDLSSLLTMCDLPLIQEVAEVLKLYHIFLNYRKRLL